MPDPPKPPSVLHCPACGSPDLSVVGVAPLRVVCVRCGQQWPKVERDVNGVLIDGP